MLEQVCSYLLASSSQQKRLFVDGTLGAGGHSLELLSKSPELHLLGLDRDPHALELASHKLANYKDRITLHNGNFDRLPEVFAAKNIPSADFFLFDLGISSMQVDTDERGFAFRKEGPLDMRMSGTQPFRIASADSVSNSEVDASDSDSGSEDDSKRPILDPVPNYPHSMSPFTSSVSSLLRGIPFDLPQIHAKALAARLPSHPHPEKRTDGSGTD